MDTTSWKQVVNEARKEEARKKEALAEAEARIKERKAEVWTVLHEFERSEAVQDASEFLEMLYREGYVLPGGYRADGFDGIRVYRSVPLELGRNAGSSIPDLKDSVWLFLFCSHFKFVFTYHTKLDGGDLALEKLLVEDPELDGEKILKLFTDFVDKEVKKKMKK